MSDLSSSAPSAPAPPSSDEAKAAKAEGTGQAPAGAGGRTAAEILRRYEKGAKGMQVEQRQYWLNAQFLLGEQWLWWNPQTRSTEQMPRDSSRVQITVNRLWPASRSLISRAMARSLVFEVPPTGADDATIQAAGTAESIINAVTREHDWESLREESLWATWKGGTALIAVEWDSSLGEPLGVNGDGRQYNTGDTVETVLSVADFVVEPGVRDARKGSWWVKQVALPPDVVQAMFDMEKPPPADAGATLSPYQWKVIQQERGGQSWSMNLTRVVTYYERPTQDFPEGQMAVVVNKDIVDEGPWPFPFKDHLNFVVLRETHVEGRWSGETVLSIALPVQAALNQSWCNIIEHMKQAGFARLMIPAGAVDMIEELTDLPGEIVVIPDGATAPGFLSPPSMPAWWIQQPMMLREELDDILGWHEISRGQAAGRVDSAAGISLLQESDTSPIGRLVKEQAIAFSNLGQDVLQVYQENVLETRQAVVKTPGQPAATVPWTGGSLLGQTACVIPPESLVPRSKAQMLQLAQSAVQMGLISTLEEFMRISEVPDARFIVEALEPDVAKAQRENHKMALGQEVLPAAFDDHTIHIRRHLDFMKGPRWDTLTPEFQENFILHNQGHEMFATEQLGRRVQQAMINPVLAGAPDHNGTQPFTPPPGPAGGPPPTPAEEPKKGAASPSKPSKSD